MDAEFPKYLHIKTWNINIFYNFDIWKKTGLM